MAKRGFFGMTTPPRPKSGAFQQENQDEKHNNRSSPSRFARCNGPDLVGGAVKSMHRTSAVNKLIICVPALRDELIANKWRMATVCLAYCETPSAVKAALKLTSKGQALLVEYSANRPKSGPSGPSGRRVNPRAGHRVEVWLTADELKDVRSAASGPVGPWIARVAVEVARKCPS